MVNAMQKRGRKKNLDAVASTLVNEREATSVGALFERDKRHSRAMSVTKPRNYNFRYGCVSPFERVAAADRNLPGRKRDDFRPLPCFAIATEEM